MSDLVLASTSRYRRAQLETLGVAFESVDPGVDEEPLQRAGLTPEALTRALAGAKARAVWQRMPGRVVIGADQVGAIDDDILTKPHTAERACAQLARLAGRTHRLVTSVCVIDAGGTEHHETDVVRLAMRSLSSEQIARYVGRDTPLDCAGSYRFESLGAALFERVEGEDPTAIVGLPLLRVTRLLERSGVRVI